MSKLPKDVDLDQDDLMDYAPDIQDEDYVFIIGPDGNLKSVMLPLDENAFETPDQVKKIMEIYNVTDLDLLCEPRVLH